MIINITDQIRALNGKTKIKEILEKFKAKSLFGIKVDYEWYYFVDVSEEKQLKCELCGWKMDKGEEYYFNGKVLCWQCYIGEVENPEHAL